VSKAQKREKQQAYSYTDFYSNIRHHITSSLGAKSHDVLITIEENVLAGGAGSAINEFLQAQKILMPVLNIALPDRFVEQGTREELLTECELSSIVISTSWLFAIAKIISSSSGLIKRILTTVEPSCFPASSAGVTMLPQARIAIRPPL
jgi:deoxyxylulose-5-phosphate synthase